MRMSDLEKAGWNRPKRVWIQGSTAMIWHDKGLDYLQVKTNLGVEKAIYITSGGWPYVWIDGDWQLD